MKRSRIFLFLTTSVLGIAAFAASKKYGAVSVCTKVGGTHLGAASLSCVTVSHKSASALKCHTTGGHTAYTNTVCNKTYYTAPGN